MHLQKLLAIGSKPIAVPLEPGLSMFGEAERGGRLEELARLLCERNGFYVFESALHVFPWADSDVGGEVVGLQAWNAEKTWREWYSDLLDGIFFFAEDVFGGQFGIRDDRIVLFEPEAGEVEPVADSLEDWACQILSNFSQMTGYPVAHAWQVANGPIPVGKRLLPKLPFILGGSFDEENLIAVDAVKGMRYRGELWQQLRDLPDGAQVKLKPLPSQ